ncbi:MAG: PQQ-binding-like beta-propeller repeat protein [Candidatus Dormibacteraeota bacterium]|nr:PQQ-binding-like beta-propeller repeat protein [Candidatus Dormibacteraeota bacterium]MBV9524406.1 PQQ-binding-like beta-propeller repeat protein [Candidatus Dormibacteraeota bacterium]
MLCGLGILAVLVSGLNVLGVSAANPPAAPTNLAAAVDGCGVHLTWTASAGASTYAVFRNGGSAISPANQTATAFTDSAMGNHATYTYSVAAWNPSGFSPQTAINVPVNIGAPGTPGGLTSSVDLLGVHLAWQPAANLCTYGVFRNGTRISPGNQTATNYNDTSMPNNATYTYTVQTWNVTGFSTPASASVAVNIPAATTPTGLQGPVDAGGVHLSWQPSANTVTYAVYRNGTYISNASQTGTVFTDTQMANNATYTYTVKSWNVTGFSAPASVNVTVKIPAPTTPTGFASTGIDTTGVHLAWNAAANTVTYAVYRNGTRISPANQTSTLFNDGTVVFGSSYTYTLQSWNVTGFSPAASLVVNTPKNPPPPPGEDWPTYLHDNARSGASGEQALNTANATALTLKWSLTTGGSVVTNPAVVGGVAYFGSWDGFEYAVNTSTGGVIWKTSLGTTTDPNCSYPTTAGITSSATVYNGAVYVGGGDSNWYALNASTGAVLWTVPTGDNSVAGAHYNWSSPLIYTATDGNTYAYIGIASNCDNPLVQGQLMQVNLTTHAVTNVAKMVPDGGQVGGGIWTSPTVDPTTNTIFVSTGTINQYTQNLAQAIVAVDATTLAVKSVWQLPFQVETFDSDWGTTPTLTTDTNGDQLLSVANKNGILYTFNRNNIAAGPIWQQQLAVGGECPTCGDGTISPGAFVSNFTIGNYTGPVLFYAAGNNMYNGKGNQGGVWAFNPGTGQVLWFHPTNGPVLGALSYENGLLAYGQGNTAEVTNAATGQALYDYTSKGAMYGAPAISHGQIFIGSTDNNLYTFALGAANTPPADPNCPAGFTCQDIGGATPGGEAVNSDGSWTITASGTKIHDVSDSFRFVWQNATGDTQLVTELTQQSTQNSLPQAGLMLRQSADPASPFYAMVEYPNNNIENQPLPKILVWYRPTWGGTAIEATKLYPAQLPRFMSIQRVGDTYYAATSSDGTNWLSLTGTTQTFAMPTTLMGGIAVDSGQNGTFGTATFTPMTAGAVTINALQPGFTHPCPQGWQCYGVGNPNPPGDQQMTAPGAFTLSGAGTGITSGVFATYGHSDQFQYVYQSAGGDQTIVAKFLGFGANPPNNAQSGLMVRATNDPGSPYYSVLAYGKGGGVVQWREDANITARFANVSLPSLAAGTYIEIVRYTDPSSNTTTYSAATSPDGVNWTFVQSATAALNLGATPMYGLAASATAVNVNPTSSFSNVSMAATGTVPPGVCPSNYSCADIGNSHRMGYQTYINHVWNMQSSGDIWDVYDTMRYIWQPLSSGGNANDDATVSVRVAGVQNPADGWAKSGVMIRGGTPDSTDPSAPYYGLFVTPSNGMVVQWRPTEGALTNQLQFAIPNSPPNSPTPIYLMVQRFTDATHNQVLYTALYSMDNVTWTPLAGSTMALNLGTPAALTGGMAASSHSTAQTMTTTFDSWNLLGSAPAPPGLCPASWNCEDIGGPLPGGTQALASGTWTINAGGGDIWDGADQFHFISQQLPADGTVTARVVNSTATNASNTWAKGGVMIRAAAGDPDASAPYYAVFVTPATGNNAASGVTVQWRSSEGTASPPSTTNQILAAGPAGGAMPNYVRVVRWTDSSHVTWYQAQTSSDGATWAAVAGSLQSIPALNGLTLAGMATDSWNQGNAVTWTMDNVAVTPGEVVPQGVCPSGWTCQDIGGATPAGSQTLTSGTWSVQGGGTDIADNSQNNPPGDQFHFVSQPLTTDGSVSAHVLSQSQSDPWAKSGVMMRVDSTPTSGYYGVFTTPTNTGTNQSNGLVVQWRDAGCGTPPCTTGQVLFNPGGANSPVVPTYVRVTRSTAGGTTTFTAFYSPDGSTWTMVPGSAIVLTNAATTMAGLAVSSHNGNQLSTVGFDTVTVSATAPPTCPTGYTCQDIGGAAPAGTQAVSGSTWTIQGAGNDIWGTADSFHLISQTTPLPADNGTGNGNGSVTARVLTQDNPNPWAKAGVMLRGDATAGAADYAILTTPAHGTVVQFRTTAGGQTQNIAVSGSGASNTAFVRVSRWTDASGSYFTAYTSPDGTTWTAVPGSTMTIPGLSGQLLAGLAVTSHANGTLGNVTMDSVAVATTAQQPGGTCPSGWTCQDVAGALPAGSQSLSGGAWTITGGGNDIWNPNDTFHYVTSTAGGAIASGAGTFSARVVSQSNTNAWAKAGLMLRAASGAPTATDAYFGIFVTAGNGIVVQYRAASGGTTVQLGKVAMPAGAPPVWLQVSRDATNNFIARYSTDGTTWTQLGATTNAPNLTGTLLEGMAVCSHAGGGSPASSVVFDNVTT